MKFGIAIAARMPMIATTIISSIRVNPFCASFFMGCSVENWEHHSWSNRPRLVLHEVYECGHHAQQKYSAFGPTTAQRRRCWQCRAGREPHFTPEDLQRIFGDE